jgi:hypothetical protein
VTLLLDALREEKPHHAYKMAGVATPSFGGVGPCEGKPQDTDKPTPM